MIKDQMTAIERMAAYANGGSIDRIPCLPVVANGAARVIGCKISDFKENSQLLAKAHLASYRLFKYDTVRIFTDLYVQAEAMGAKVLYPPDETAHLEAPACDDLSEIEKLKPADPLKDGNLPYILEALKIAIDEVGHEVPVSGAVIGPFTNASFLIGTDNLVRMTYKDPEAVHRLCQLSLETSLAYAKAMIDTGCSAGVTEPMSSSTIISPSQFAAFSYPYLKKLIDYIHSRGKRVTLHICGKTNKIWDLMVEAGADCLSIDNVVDLEEAKVKVGHKVMLMGNVNPSQIMLQGTPEDVRKATIACVKKAYDNPKGYIVATGCSLPADTPFDNIHAMLDTVREIGYPVNIGNL